MSRQGTLQQRPSAGPLLAALLVGLLLMPIHAAAAEQVGRVLVATGSVTAEQEDASARALGRRDPIYAGDRIRTSARGRVQIRFEDGAMVDLDPSSTFEVEEYASEDEDEDGGGSAIMSFLTGAMRTITGAIGGNRGDEYRLNTTVATIGVRGTAYALEYCDAECAGEDGEIGLYGRVDDGEVEVDGPGGTGEFSKGQYFFVPDGGAPERIVAPPDGILEGDGETGAGGDDDRIEDVSIKPLDTGDEDGIDLGGNDTDLLDPDFESAEITDLGDLDPVEPRPGSTADVFFGGGFVLGGASGTLDESAFVTSPVDGDVRLDGSELIGAEFPANGFVDATEMTLAESGTSTPFYETAVTLEWGRWAGPVSVEGEDTGPADGGFVYAYTDVSNVTPSSTLAGEIDQTAGYDNFSLTSPLAVASTGELWDVVNFSMTVDFQADSAFLNSFDLSRISDGSQLDMAFSPPSGVVDDSTSSLSFDGLSDSDGTYDGNIRGKFLGSSGDLMILRFELNETNGSTTINGITLVEPGS